MVAVTIFVPQIWFKIVLPDYKQADLNSFEETLDGLSQSDRIRITVRATDFDDFTKEFTTYLPSSLEGSNPKEKLKNYGLVLGSRENATLAVDQVEFNSMAEKTGFDTMNMDSFFITKVETPTKHPFNPKLLFIPALIVFIIIFMIQTVRRKKFTAISIN
jgi:hypothetical protein